MFIHTNWNLEKKNYLWKKKKPKKKNQTQNKKQHKKMPKDQG